MYKLKQLKPQDVVEVIRLGIQHDEFQCIIDEDFWQKQELIAWFKNDSDICLGIFKCSTMLGFCLSHINPSINKVYLENIFIHNDYRKEGLGERLLSKTIDMYKEKYNSKAESLRFIGLTHESNLTCISLVKKCGFLIGEKMVWLQK